MQLQLQRGRSAGTRYGRPLAWGAAEAVIEELPREPRLPGAPWEHYHVRARSRAPIARPRLRARDCAEAAIEMAQLLKKMRS